jgi:hypothetical protein
MSVQRHCVFGDSVTDLIEIQICAAAVVHQDRRVAGYYMVRVGGGDGGIQTGKVACVVYEYRCVTGQYIVGVESSHEDSGDHPAHVSPDLAIRSLPIGSSFDIRLSRQQPERTIARHQATPSEISRSVT